MLRAVGSVRRVRLLPVAVLAALAACAEAPAARPPDLAAQERQRQADIADERARMARVDQAEADAAERRRVRRVAIEAKRAHLAREREAESRSKAAAGAAAPCFVKSTESPEERARWEGARWVEKNCEALQPAPVIVCRPVCVKQIPCPIFSCPSGTAQEWVDLANQAACGGARESRRAELVDAPCSSGGD